MGKTPIGIGDNSVEKIWQLSSKDAIINHHKPKLTGGLLYVSGIFH